MESLYRIVFTGELAPGRSPQEAIDAFAARFQVSEDRARDLILGGRELILKHNLSRKRAARYRAALEQTGLVVAIEPQNPGPTDRVPDELEPSVNSPYSQLPESEVQLSETVVGLSPQDLEQRKSAPAPRDIPLDPNPCPKCGAVQVSQLTGVCQACGVVVERYLARLAAERGESPPSSPYAPPKANLTPPAAPTPVESLSSPRGVAAGRGWGWLADAWPLFAAQPWAWIGALLLLLLIYVVLGLIPVVGGLVPTVLGPVFTGGLAIGAHTQHQGGRFQLEHLFAGFSRKPGGLLLVGVASIGLFLVVGLAIGLSAVLIAGAFDLAPASAMDPAQIEEIGPMVLLLVAIGMLLLIPVAMALFFAPYLVALNDVPVLAALRLSFQGCWRNVLPFLVFSLAIVGLGLASLLTLGLAWLVLMPLLTLAVYIAFREIYYGK